MFLIPADLGSHHAVSFPCGLLLLSLVKGDTTPNHSLAHTPPFPKGQPTHVDMGGVNVEP